MRFLNVVQQPSEEARHVATETLRDLLTMYQEDTLKKVTALGGKAASAEA